VVAVDPPNGRHLDRHLPIGWDVIPAKYQVPMPSPSSIMSAVLVTLTHSENVHYAVSWQCNEPAAVAKIEKSPSWLPDAPRAAAESATWTHVDGSSTRPLRVVEKALNYPDSLCRQIIARVLSNTRTGDMKCGAHNVSGTVLRH
jgi:hypothetical protein